MSKHNRLSRHRERRPSRVAALAMSAIAGCTVGLGVLASAATAQADDCVDSDLACGWFSGILNGNALQLGTNGNGNTNQIGIANGNIANGQLNIPILSPVIAGGNAVNAAPTLGGLAHRWCGDQCRRRRGCTGRRRGDSASTRQSPVWESAAPISVRRWAVWGSAAGESAQPSGVDRWRGGPGDCRRSNGTGSAPRRAGTGGQDRFANGWRRQRIPAEVAARPTPRATGGEGDGGDADNDQEAGDGEGGDANSNQNITRGGNATSTGSATSGTANGGAASGGSATQRRQRQCRRQPVQQHSTNNTSSGNGNNSSNSTG